MSLKQKTTSGLLWSFIDSVSNQVILFIVGIILARILSPKEFGLIGMLTIFIAVSQLFINSGFSQALIRKKNPSQTDYSTVFYFNLIISIICFLILFFSAGLISRFFDEPQLKPLVKVMGLSIVFNAFNIIQQTILSRRIDFKLLTKISIISSLTSGFIAIGMALAGYGVWSLVIKMISMSAITSILYWLWNKWKPVLVFSINTLKELFPFGSNLLISGLIDTIYRNVFYIIIGKYYSAQDLGYYTRADQFSALPSSNLTWIIQRVSYPVLSSIKEDIPKLKEAYKKLIRSTMLICFVLMLGMAAIAKPMIFALVGEKWEPCVTYLQMLCLVGMFFPLHALNLNMLEIEGRTNLFLRLEIIKKVMAIPIITIGIFWGIKIMILGMIVNTIISYYLNSYWSGRFIGYSFLEQIKDIIPSFLLAAVMSSIVYVLGLLIPISPLPLLIIQIISGAVLTIGICEAFNYRDYIYIKEIVIDNFNKITTHDRKTE
jgi:teichuronic acid exporter